MMRYIVLLIVVLAILVSICYALLLGVRYLTKRSRQRHLARSAPQLLQYEDLDPRIAELLIQQRRALETGVNIVSQMLNDQVMLIPSEYSNPLEQWVETNRKELGR